MLICLYVLGLEVLALKKTAIFYDENLKEALSTDQKFVSQAHKYMANNVCLNFSLF